MRKYRLVAKKGEGTFSEVLKAQNVKDGRYHAIKCMKNRFESIDQVNNLREIQALRRLSPHDHVITLEEVLYDQPTGRLALVFELMDANLYELIKGRRHYLNPQLIKSYIWQLMKSLDHMHKKGIFHRDIKPENILIESGTDIGKGLKLADFGSCRGIYSKQPYTEYISTRWYRAPECLLTDGYYGPEMDLWGAGCVMFEITSLYPLFPGSNESDQINRIHKILGTPSVEIINKLKSKGASHISFDFPEQKGVGLAQLVPNAPPDALDLMTKLLKYDGSERITAREAMRHPYLKEMRELDHKRNAEGVSPTSAAVTGTFPSNEASSLSSTTKVVPTKSNNAQISSEESVVSQLTNTTKSGNNHQAKALPSIDTTANKGSSGVVNSKGMPGISPSSTGVVASLPPIHNTTLSHTNTKILPKGGASNGATGLFGSTTTTSNAGSTVLGSTSNSVAGGAGGSSHGNKKKPKKINKNLTTATSSVGPSGNHSQNAEQILKSYGLAKHQGVDSLKPIGSTNPTEGKPTAIRYNVAKKN